MIKIITKNYFRVRVIFHIRWICYFLFYNLIITNSIVGQISFSQFTKNPLLFNPAYTGHFNQDIKLSGSFRNQQSASGQLFTKSLFAIEKKIFKKYVADNDCLSVAFTGMNDVGNNSGINNSSFLFSSAFQKSVSETGEQFLSAGFQISYSNFTLKRPNIIFEDQLVSWNNFGYSNLDLSAFNNVQVNYFDLNVGVNFQGELNDRNKYTIGGSLNNITKPKKRFPGGDLNIEQQAWGHVSWESKTKRLDKFSTSVLVGSQNGKVNVFSTGIFYKKFVKNKTAISVGSLFRNASQLGNAIVPSLGLYFKDIEISLSNDIPVTSKTSNLMNAFEISMNYLFSRSKRGINEDKFTNF